MSEQDEEGPPPAKKVKISTETATDADSSMEAESPEQILASLGTTASTETSPQQIAQDLAGTQETSPQQMFISLDTATREKLQRKLYEAAHYGFTKALKTLLDSGIPVDKQDTKEHKEYTALMYACDHPESESGPNQSDCRLEAVRMLLDKQVDILKKNKYKMTALYVACHHGQLDIVRAILTHCDPKRASEVARILDDQDIMTAEDRIRDARGDVSYQSDKLHKLLNTKSKKYWTALMTTLNRGHMDIVCYLLAFNETDISCINKEGQTVVHIAARFGSLEALKLLAAVDETSTMCETVDKNGWSVLEHACARKSDCLEVLKWLLERFPQLEKFLSQKATTKGFTPLHIACTYHNRECVEYLLSLPDVDPKAQTTDGMTALHLAAMHDEVEIAEWLIGKGCPLDVQDSKYGNSALHIACERGSQLVEDMLREKGGTEIATLVNKEGKTADKMETKSKYPSEIRKRGEDAMRIYRDALKDGKRKVPRCKLLILGDERVGKTSLIDSLTGEPFRDTNPTEGIDTSLVETKTVGTRCVDPEWTILKRGDNLSQFHDIAAAEICGKVGPLEARKIPAKPLKTYESEDKILEEINLLLQPPLPKVSVGESRIGRDVKRPIDHHSDILPTFSNHPLASTAGASGYKVPGAPTSTTRLQSVIEEDHAHVPVRPRQSSRQSLNKSEKGAIASSPTLKTQKLPEQASAIPVTSRRFSRSVDARMKDSHKNEPELRFVIYDFAGQPLYRPMHHCFITPRAMYIVAFKLNELVKKKNREPCYQQIAYWLNTIHAHIDRDKQVYVYMVGTHRDTPHEENKLTENVIKEINGEMSKRLFSNIRWVEHIQPPADGKILTAIENSENEAEKSGAKILLEELPIAASQLEFLEEEYPIKWLKFEEELFRMRRRAAKPGIVELSKVHDLAKTSGIIDEDQINLALTFLHDLGTIVYPRVLPTLFLSEDEKKQLHDAVLLDPQQLADVMKVLMKTDPTAKLPGRDIKRSDLQELPKYGRAKESLLRSLWSEFLSESDEHSFAQLCLFLQAFCLIIPAKCIDPAHIAQETNMAKSQETHMAESQETNMAESQETSIAESQETSMAESQETCMAELQETRMAESQKTSIEESQETSMAEMQETSMAELQETSMAESQQTSMDELQETSIAEPQETCMAKSQETSMVELQETSRVKLQETCMAESQETSLAESQETSMAESQKTSMSKLLLTTAPSNQASTPIQQKQEFIIPCMLDQTAIETPHVFSQGCVQFYFDFEGYLPIEVFHRFVYLMVVKHQKMPLPHTHRFHYSQCQLTDSDGNEWWVEVQEKEHRLNVMVSTQCKEDNPVNLVRDAHNFLARICVESGLQGITYTGGPLCPKCRSVLPLVNHEGKYDQPQLTTTVKCKNQDCWTTHDALPLLNEDGGNGGGPGGLGEDDLFDILEEVTDVTKWFDTGLALGLKYSTLEKIKIKNREDVDDCRRDMIVSWLRKMDRVNQTGLPSWRSLVRALSSAVAYYPEIAKEIARKHAVL